MKSLMLAAIALVMLPLNIQAQQYGFTGSPQTCCNQSCCRTSSPFTMNSTNVYTGPSYQVSGNYSMPVTNISQPAMTTTMSPIQYGTAQVVNDATMPSTYPVQGTIVAPSNPVAYTPVAQTISYGVNEPSSFVQPTNINGYVVGQSMPQYTSFNATGGLGSGLAQRKAQQAAQAGIQGHVGGGLGNAKYEGVGWSSRSAQDAIQHCCYWGTRPVSQIGVARGSNGLWYACVLYQ